MPSQLELKLELALVLELQLQVELQLAIANWQLHLVQGNVAPIFSLTTIRVDAKLSTTQVLHNNCSVKCIPNAP